MLSPYLVACLLACWTSQQSRKPWDYVAQAIRKVDAMGDLRSHIVKGVQNALQQHSGHTDELCETLAQLVIQHAKSLGPGVLDGAHIV